MKSYKEFMQEAYTKFDDKTYDEVEFPKDMIRMVKRLTKENDHNNARIIVADVLASVGNRSGAGFKKRYDSIAKIQQKNGEMTPGFLKTRNNLDKAMKTELQRTFSNWKQVWAAL